MQAGVDLDLSDVPADAEAVQPQPAPIDGGDDRRGAQPAGLFVAGRGLGVGAHRSHRHSSWSRTCPASSPPRARLRWTEGVPSTERIPEATAAASQADHRGSVAVSSMRWGSPVPRTPRHPGTGTGRGRAARRRRLPRPGRWPCWRFGCRPHPAGAPGPGRGSDHRLVGPGQLLHRGGGVALAQHPVQLGEDGGQFAGGGFGGLGVLGLPRGWAGWRVSRCRLRQRREHPVSPAHLDGQFGDAGRGSGRGSGRTSASAP